MLFWFDLRISKDLLENTQSQSHFEKRHLHYKTSKSGT